MIKKIFLRFDLFVTFRFYLLVSIFIVLFIAAYIFPFLHTIVALVGAAVLMFFAAELVILFIPNRPLTAKRSFTSKWSLGDDNPVEVSVKNNTPLPWRVMFIDEVPVQLQERNFKMKRRLKPNRFIIFKYFVNPKNRGEYEYGAMRFFLYSFSGVFMRRCTIEEVGKAAVYPSIIQMKKYSLLTINKLARFYGVKKMRRIGQSYEFEQIMEYVPGDDTRHINWKATGKTGTLKTNHYIEERAQPVYCVVDKSRLMNFAFNDMVLLDYAINASLVISNTALQKGDKCGLVTFSDRVGSAIRADDSPGQLNRILEALYAQKYRTCDADYEFLFNALQRVTNGRSLLILFTNFESMNALQRVMPILQKINNRHLLLTVIFTNKEVEEFAYQQSKDLREAYDRNIARNYIMEKKRMVSELKNRGIQTILTKPEELTINTLNKYLELKAKGLI